MCPTTILHVGQHPLSPTTRPFSPPYPQVEHTDLINFGLIPEFVGRLPVIVTLQVGWAAAGRQPACLPYPACRLDTFDAAT